MIPYMPHSFYLPKYSSHFKIVRKKYIYEPMILLVTPFSITQNTTTPILGFYCSSPTCPVLLRMVPELEKPRITEIQVRIDCNGCVQKIKKALNCINGIYEIYIDLPKQKITVIGWADPEKIIKAIKKTRRTATICSHSELPQQSGQSSEGPPPEGGGPPPEGGGPPPEGGGTPPEGGGPPPEGGGPPPEGGGPPPEGGGPPPEGGGPPQEGGGPPPEGGGGPPPPQDANPPQPEPEPPKDQQQHGPPPPPAENQAPETVTQPTGPETSSSQPPPQYPSRPYKDVGEVHVHPVHHYSSHHHPVDYRSHHQPHNYHPPDYHPPDYSYRYDYGPYRYNPAYSQGGPQGYGGYGPAANYSYRQERPEPVHVSHSYSTHRPSPYVTQYHEYAPSTPQYTSSTPNIAPMDHQQYHYTYGDYYRNGSSYNNGSVTSVFSDENPNACTIV